MAPSRFRERCSVWLHRGDKSHSDEKTQGPELNIAQGPKIVAERQAKAPQALPFASVDVQPTAANPGTKDPPPGIESGVQQDQNLHQRLWDDAYDSLEEENETTELVEAYVKTLTKVLEEENAKDISPTGASDVSAEIKGHRKKATETFGAGAIDISAGLKHRANRQEYMRKLVDDGKKRVVKSSRITKAIGDVADATLLAKPIVDVMMSIPQAAPAALPWAGFCIGLQMLSNPAKTARFNREGMTHVVNRMQWYAALTEHLLDTDSADISFKSTLQQLKQKIVELYKAILLYQMKSVCSYYKHQGLVFLQTLLPDKWTEDLESVTDAETELLNDWGFYDRVRATKVRNELTELTKSMESSLLIIHQDLREFIDQQHEIQADGENKECLQDLRVVNPQDDMKRIEKQKEKLLDEAYKWMLKDEKYEAFINWHESDRPSCRLLWVKGHAGTGKTMLVIGIIREFSNQLAMSAPSLSFFFCQSQGKTVSLLNNVTATLRSLIWMLLIQQPGLISHLQAEYRSSRGKMFEDDNAQVALSRIFLEMLKVAQPVYFIVDALDECENGLLDLLSLISESLTLSDKVRWLVSSRPEVDITTKLQNPEICKIVDLNAQKLDGPVNKYIEYKLSALRGRKGYTEEILTIVSDKIHQRAENTFLWVAIVFKTLDSKYGWDAIKTVENIPPGLSELYDHMMTRIEGQNEDTQQRCKNALVASTLAYRPLYLSELEVLAELPPGSPETIVEECGSFLTINEGMVSRIHQSAQDYLRKDLKCLDQNHKSRLQMGGVAQGHADITRRSIDAMSKRLNRDIYGLRQYGFKPKDTRPSDPNPLTPIRYSCVFWLSHLREAIKTNLGDEKDLCDLGLKHLREHSLHWIESLSLLGKFSDGVQSIRTLLRQLQSGVSLQLAAFLKDVEKFVLNHRSIIERAPMQAYGSALVFSSEMSELRNGHWDERLSFIKSVAGVRGHWDAQTLEDHSGRIRAAAFSPDGKTLASSLDDHVVRLWDTTADACKQTLKDHNGYIIAVTFSPDGKTLASGSDDHTVRLWDAANGACQHTLEGHRDWVRTVAYSPDGKTLASASADHTIRLWDAVTGLCQQMLDGHGDWVIAVAFSPDGKTLASASADHTVRLWDAATGVCQQMLEGHNGWINTIAFSPDGKTLASSSDDHAVRLWDVATGACQQTLKDHTGDIITVAFSPDGKTLISASDDNTVWLWDTTTGIPDTYTYSNWNNYIILVTFSPDGKPFVCINGDRTLPRGNTATGTHQQVLKGHRDIIRAVFYSPLNKAIPSALDDHTVRLWDEVTGEGHRGWVRTVAFSPDGKTVASVSDDYTVRLWVTAKDTRQQRVEGHRDRVRAVAFSPDSKTLASVSADRTVRLWDAATGTCQHTLEGHNGWVRTVAFSPDGKTLASSSDDHAVRLWDVAIGACQHTLEGHNGWVNTIAFSPDGKTLASASADHTVRLWDAATGVCQQMLVGHGDWVIAVAFSPDGKTLASASADHTVRLWLVATGACQHMLEGHRDSVRTVAYSPDGKTLASSSADRTVRLWDAATGACQRTLEGHNGWVNTIAFSPDGKRLASSSDDHAVRLWDVATGACQQKLEDHSRRVTMVAFSEDDRCLKTDRGFLRLSSESDSPDICLDQKPSDYALFVEHEWIVRNSENLLWLPQDYRATCVAVDGDTVVLGHASGGVTFLRFDFSQFDSIIK